VFITSSRESKFSVSIFLRK